MICIRICIIHSFLCYLEVRENLLLDRELLLIAERYKSCSIHMWLNIDVYFVPSLRSALYCEFNKVSDMLAIKTTTCNNRAPERRESGGAWSVTAQSELIVSSLYRGSHRDSSQQRLLLENLDLRDCESFPIWRAPDNRALYYE